MLLSQTTTFILMPTSLEAGPRGGLATTHGSKHSRSCSIHTLVLAAKRVSRWDNSVDAFIMRWDGEDVTIPTDGEAEWRTNSGEREVVVERTDDTNTVKVTVNGLVEVDVRVIPIGEEENRVHNYQLPSFLCSLGDTVQVLQPIGSYRGYSWEDIQARVCQPGQERCANANDEWGGQVPNSITIFPCLKCVQVSKTI